MGLFDKISSVLERKATDVSNFTWGELFPGHIKSGVSVNVWTALRTTTVLACSRVIAEGIAQMPIGLFDIDPENNTKTRNITHPAYHLLSCEPNEWMTAFEMREMMTMHAVLTGNAYAYLGWSGPANARKLIEIIPLMPHQVQVVRETDYTLLYDVVDLSGKVTRLTADAILHLRGPSWDGYLGLDAIQLAREAIGLAIATEETHASLHANGAQPGGVLSIKSKLDDKARARLKEQWQNFQGGVGNRFKTAVLDMDADWKALSMSGVDSQHLETRRFQIEEICRAMRVFPQLVMHSDKTSTFASAEAFFLAHVTHSLMPWIVRWEQAINRTILGDDDNLICKLNVASMMRGDANQRAAFYQAALGGARGETAYMTRNEVRALEDMNPIEGGDKLLLPPPPADPTVAPPGVGGGSKFNPNHDAAGRFAPAGGGGGGSGGNDGSESTGIRADEHHVRNLLGKLALHEAAKHALKTLIRAGAARYIVESALETLPGGVAVSIAAEVALRVAEHYYSDKSGTVNLDGLTPDQLDAIAQQLVETLNPDDLQTLFKVVTGATKSNPNHDELGHFASLPLGQLQTERGADLSGWRGEPTPQLEEGGRRASLAARNAGIVDGLRSVLRSGRELDPVLVSKTDTGNYKILDGHHRYVAYELEGRTHIPAIVSKLHKSNPNHDSLGRFATGPGGGETNPVGNGTPREKLARLEALTAVNFPTVQAMVEKIDRLFGTKSEADIKKSEKILEKATRPDILADKPWFGVEHIRDSLRFKTIVDSFAAVRGIVSQLENSGDFNIIKYDTAKLTDPKEWGWRMLPIDLQTKNGQMVEYYILSKEQAEVAKEGHEVYFEKWRNVKRADMTPVQIEERAKDVVASSKLNGDAWKKYLARTGQTESDVRASVTRA
jgi:HK97 family phage portal protein